MNDSEMINKFLEQQCIGYDFTNNRFSRSIFKERVRMQDGSEVIRYGYIDTNNNMGITTRVTMLTKCPYIDIHTSVRTQPGYTRYTGV